MGETREHIIDLADSLIRKRGFNAFSYSDIATMLDIRNAAVHYHFPSKSDLGNAVMEAEVLRLTEYRRQHGGLPGDEQLKHLVETFYYSAQTHMLCLVGALTPEFATFDDGMQMTLQRMCAAIRDWITDFLGQARTTGRLHFEGTAEDRAVLVLSTLLSSLLLSRVEGQELFRRMLDRLLEDLGADWRTGELPAPDGSLTTYHSFT